MTELLAARGLSRRFGGVHALRDVHVVQRRSETLGMIGPNGSGKTSFVNVITGHLALDRGAVTFAGRCITGARPYAVVRGGLVRTYQAVQIFGRLSARENFDMAARLHARNPERTWTQVAEAELLTWLRLDHLLDTQAASLTLFEQRRLELAMRLALRPKLMMLDEPAAGLAPGEMRQMIALLQETKARCTLFVIEHTMKVIRELADRVVVLIAGEKVADGPPAEILMDRRIVEHYLGAARA